MAFKRTNLSGNLGAGSGAPKLFTHDGSADTKAAVIATSYFDDAADVLNVGDIIISTTTTVVVALYVVSITAGVVVTDYVAVA